MPKRQKQTKDDKILQCERKPPSLTLGNFLDSQLAPKAEDVVPETSASRDVKDDDDKPPATNEPCFTIRKNKKGSLPISYENRASGKKVTVISNVSGDASSLVSELKKMTGSGGVQKGETIELQGDRRDFVQRFLKGHPCVVQYK